ncbi:ribonuclease T2 family protein [Rhodobacter capsulatus]|uniref:ribonuclease T2 family protein n=1 Tax=Rhodobacter capsulatus TaxID=1061 RepID=UPI00402758F4
MRFFAICAAVLLACHALAEGERAGDFDYYVLALSWSPGWCATDGKGRNARQCDPGSGADFVLHGLWPQYEAGWPSYCRTTARDPSRAQSAAMADVMGSDGAAWYQWKKHGRCSGLTAADYFATARQAYESVAIPVPFQQLARDVRLPAEAVEQAFLDANPRLSPEMVTVTCAGERIDEVRICLTKDLVPRRCGADVRRDCRKPDAVMERVR